MRVKCIGRTRAALSEAMSRAAYERNVHQDEVGLVVGRVYEVFGIGFRDGGDQPWYLVCEEEDDDYPTPHLGAFFSIIDSSIPPEWAVAVGGNAGSFAILPRKWADDPSFMEKLVDGQPEAVALFAEIRRSRSA